MTELHLYTVTWRLPDQREFTIKTESTTPEDAAERMFLVANGMAEGPDAERWDAMRHRSLSVGDHVTVDREPYLCDSIGWRPSRETDPKNMEDRIGMLLDGGSWAL